MSNATSFIGNIPFEGKLNVITTPSTEYIGLLEVHYQPVSTTNIGSNRESASGLGSNRFMYFKEYTLENNDVVFHDLFQGPDTRNPNDVYRFDMAFMRIPEDLTYLTARKEGENWIITENAKDKMYSGLTLFNIHKEGDGSLSDKNFLYPNEHFDTSGIESLVNNLLFSNTNTALDIRTDAECGCSKPPPNRANQFPLFRKDHKLGNNQFHYYMLGVITDNTVCYFETGEVNDLGAEMDYVLVNSSYTNKVGFAHHECPKYNVKDFKNKFGIHILNKTVIGCDREVLGWNMGPWNTIKY